MILSRTWPVLRSKLGDDGLLDLHGMLEPQGKEWKADLIDTASDRFERRLCEELGPFRLAVAREFELVRLEIANTRVELLRWMFAFWVAQLGASLATTAFLVHALSR